MECGIAHYGPLCPDHIEIYMQNKIVLTFICASAALGPGHACSTLKQSELRYFLLEKPTLYCTVRILMLL